MWHLCLWLSAANHISFLPNRFSVKCKFLFPILLLTVKSPTVTQRSVSQENAFKKNKNLSAFFRKTISSNNSFTLIENNFRVVKIAKIEFKVTVHYSVWAICTQLWRLNPRPPKGLLQPPKIFLKQLFCPINCAKRFNVIISISFYIFWCIWGEIRGVVWVWGSSKRMVEGVGEIPWFLFCPFL